MRLTAVSVRGPTFFRIYRCNMNLGGGLGSRLVSVLDSAATLSGNSLKQTVHAHRASVHQAAKLVAALLRVTAGLAESNGSLPPGL